MLTEGSREISGSLVVEPREGDAVLVKSVRFYHPTNQAITHPFEWNRDYLHKVLGYDVPLIVNRLRAHSIKIKARFTVNANNIAILPR